MRVISHLYSASRSNLWDAESHFQVVKAFGWVTRKPKKKKTNVWILKTETQLIISQNASLNEQLQSRTLILWVGLGRPRRPIELIMWDSEIYYGTDYTFNLTPCSHWLVTNQPRGVNMTFKRQTCNSLIGQFWCLIRTQMGQSNCSASTDSDLFSILMLLMCIFMLFGDLKSSLTGKTEYKNY